jgi:hypothetical protein
MKNFVVVLVGSILLGSLVAGQSRPQFTEKKLKQIDRNLVQCLKSDIPCVVCTALKTVRDVKALAPEYSFSHEMTIALMRIVKDEKRHQEGDSAGSVERCCNVRILAAVALNDMKSEMGDYAIKMQAKFTQSKRLKYICTWLAYNRMIENQGPSTIREGEGHGVVAK